MGWINVKDSMPATIGNCLVYTKDGKIAWSFFNSDDMFAGDGEYYDATHWMPLPKPPTNKKENKMDNKEYEPFGEAWENEIIKMNKRHLVKMLGDALKEILDLKIKVMTKEKQNG